MKKILILGTKEKTSKFYSFFINQGFICIQTPSEIETFNYINNEWFDLVLMINSFKHVHSGDIFEKIKRISSVPIVMIINSEDTSEIVKTLKSGADVCLTNLVDEDELMARVEAVLRRSEFNSKIYNP